MYFTICAVSTTQTQLHVLVLLCLAPLAGAQRGAFFFFFTFISPHFGTAFNSYRIFFCFVGVVLAPLAPPEAKPISLSFASFGFISPVFDAVY